MIATYKIGIADGIYPRVPMDSNPREPVQCSDYTRDKARDFGLVLRCLPRFIMIAVTMPSVWAYMRNFALEILCYTNSILLLLVFKNPSSPTPLFSFAPAALKFLLLSSLRRDLLLSSPISEPPPISLV